jgi:hypothetical protein
MGQRFAWRRSDACPCVNPHSGAPDPYCPHCGGKGRIWGAAVEGTCGIAGAKVQREWATFGVWEQGDVVLSIPSDSALYAMNQYDRAVMLNSTSPFSQVMDGAKIGHHVASIDRVFWLHPETRAIVEGGIPTVAVDGTLSWASGAPPEGVVYTITGRRSPEYFCWGEYPQDRAHHHGAALPRRVVLRKYDLMNRA